MTGKRHAVQHGLAGHGVAEVVQADVLDAGLAPHRDTRASSIACPGSREGSLTEGKTQGSLPCCHAALDDLPRLGIQQDGSRPGLAVAEFEPVVLYLVPAETDDLVLAAPCEQQQADDVGLLRM